MDVQIQRSKQFWFRKRCFAALKSFLQYAFQRNLFLLVLEKDCIMLFFQFVNFLIYLFGLVKNVFNQIYPKRNEN